MQGRFVALRAFFDFFYVGGVGDAVPAHLIRPRWVTKLLTRALTVHQVRVSLDKTTNVRDRAFLEFLYATACRHSKVLRLRVEDVDMG